MVCLLGLTLVSLLQIKRGWHAHRTRKQISHTSTKHVTTFMKVYLSFLLTTESSVITQPHADIPNRYVGGIPDIRIGGWHSRRTFSLGIYNDFQKLFTSVITIVRVKGLHNIFSSVFFVNRIPTCSDPCSSDCSPHPLITQPHLSLYFTCQSIRHRRRRRPRPNLGGAELSVIQICFFRQFFIFYFWEGKTLMKIEIFTILGFNDDMWQICIIWPCLFSSQYRDVMPYREFFIAILFTDITFPLSHRSLDKDGQWENRLEGAMSQTRTAMWAWLAGLAGEPYEVLCSSGDYIEDS